MTLTPSFILSEEYNDNIFLDNSNKQWDFVGRVSPAILLVANRANYQLSLGYATVAELYARESNLSSALANHSFVGAGTYRATQSLTLSLTDSFVWDRNSGVVAGFATGREESWTNTITPSMSWRVTPSDTWNISGSYSVLRFQGSGSGLDSDSYGFGTTFGHAFTPRFTGGVGFTFSYVVPQVGDTSTTYTPVLGFSYRLTPTLTVAMEGGPGVTNISGGWTVTPTGTARLTQAFTFGTAGLEYTRGVYVAGGFGGPTDTQTVSASLYLTTLIRGLTVLLGPSYSKAESLSSSDPQQVDVSSVNLRAALAYQFNQYATIFAGYTFIYQRTGSHSTEQRDVDQNVVRFGVQFGYPFHFN